MAMSVAYGCSMSIKFPLQLIALFEESNFPEITCQFGIGSIAVGNIDSNILCLPSQANNHDAAKYTAKIIPIT